MTGETAKILVVDDEAPIRKFLRITLTAAGYEVVETASASACLAAIERDVPDLAILDLGLPDADGQELIQAIRARSAVPIIVLSVRRGETDKVVALDAGANDFVTKPFAVGELLARIRAALRTTGEAATREGPLEVGALRLDPERHSVTVGGRAVKLTPREFAFLELLMRHAGKVLTHKTILEQVWGPAHREDTQYLRVYVRQLRRKLGDDPVNPRFITNEPGVGYRLPGELSAER
jgi:two-component system, OmpR family, KDP operon response regulator KdpE